MKYKFLIVCGLIGLGSSFTSCNNSTEPSAAQEEAMVPDTLLPQNPTANGEINLEALPSPVRISYLFYQAYLDFQPSLLHPIATYDNYTLGIDRLIAFGVYSSDLAYAAFNQRESEAKERFVLLEKISSDLGFSFPEENKTLLERFEKNITQMDTIIHLLSRYQLMVDDYIQANGEQSKAMVVFASAWLETLYLGCSVKNLDVNAELLETLIYQNELCHIIVSNLETIEDFRQDDRFLLMIDRLTSVQQAFDEIGLPEDESVDFEIKRIALHYLVDEIFESRKQLLSTQSL